jgi:hypothetical protein
MNITFNEPDNVMEALIYAANGLYVASYLVRDILHLRIFSIIAACCLVGYFNSQTEPMLTVIAWNLFFIGLNAFQLGRILGERQRRKGETNSTRSAVAPADC